jgi:hypothetical protein
MSKEATALGFEGEERAQFMSKQKKVLARQIKLSAGELDIMQMRDHQLARAALDKESEKLSKAYQSKHAKASGRGKRKQKLSPSLGKGGKVGRDRLCIHPEHDPTCTRKLRRRGTPGFL